MLEDKQAWRGDTVLAVPPRGTSQRCAECSDVDAANRVQQSLFSCKRCGHSSHADINAAQNILAAGQADRCNAYSPL
jgi:putative transposase